MRILVLAAHPDDEVLGPGGTLAAHAAAGDEVHAVVLSEGASSRYDAGMQGTLEAAGRKCAARLGIASIRFEAWPDQRLDTRPLVELTQSVETLLREVNPEVVYTHFADDVNFDHGIVARAVWTACRPYAFPGVRRVLAFETPSSTEWGAPGVGRPFCPNVFVDIEATLDAKIEAFACYESEVRDAPHPRSLESLRRRAAYWGSVSGRQAVEPFILLRELA